jgi:hypothetical protein
MRTLVAAWVAATVIGCGGDEGRSPEAQTCTQLSRACGYDDSGRACARCPVDRACAAGQCVPLCTPACADRPCGTPDGCGGSCAGACSGGQVCLRASVCAPVAVSTPPASHTLAAGTLPVFRAFAGVAFTTPSPMEVSFGARSPLDTFSVGLFAPADWADFTGGLASPSAVGFREGIIGADGRASLEAGTYYLGFRCDTPGDQGCSVGYAILAHY